LIVPGTAGFAREICGPEAHRERAADVNASLGSARAALTCLTALNGLAFAFIYAVISMA
jgi:hypothetical protein